MVTGLSGTPTPDNSPESSSRPRSAYVAKLGVALFGFVVGWRCCNYYKVVGYGSNSLTSDG